MSNILKQYRVAGEDKNVRVINSNSMIKQIFADSISRPADSYTGISSDAQSSLEKTKSLSPDTQESGFNDGINAAVVTEIDVSAEKERLLEEAKLEADSILDKAKAEASRLLDEAKQRAQILYADNKSKGYEDGLAECQREFDEKEISLRQELSDKESALKSKYDAYSKELESDLIDAIIQVFNKVFKIQFDDKKDILFHLVENTMSNIEVGKEFRIHVAYSNYKFMMSHLDEIQERIGNDIDIEVVNDANLDTSGCFIETSFGVFDCGIVLVTTPEPTSITDSYSLLKALYKRPDFDPSKVCIRVISNRAASKEDGSIVFNKINSVVMQFLNGSLEYLGYVPSDAMVEKAVRQQKILSIYDPTSKAARSFEEIAKRLLDNESAALDEKRTISHVFSNFFNRKQ